MVSSSDRYLEFSRFQGLERVFLKFASGRLFNVQIMNIKLELCCLLPITIPNLADSKDEEKNDDFRGFFLNSLLVGYLKCR